VEEDDARLAAVICKFVRCARVMVMSVSILATLLCF